MVSTVKSAANSITTTASPVNNALKIVPNGGSPVNNAVNIEPNAGSSINNELQIVQNGGSSVNNKNNNNNNDIKAVFNKLSESAIPDVSKSFSNTATAVKIESPRESPLTNNDNQITKSDRNEENDFGIDLTDQLKNRVEFLGESTNERTSNNAVMTGTDIGNDRTDQMENRVEFLGESANERTSGNTMLTGTDSGNDRTDQMENRVEFLSESANERTSENNVQKDTDGDTDRTDRMENRVEFVSERAIARTSKNIVQESTDGDIDRTDQMENRVEFSGESANARTSENSEQKDTDSEQDNTEEVDFIPITSILHRRRMTARPNNQEEDDSDVRQLRPNILKKAALKSKHRPQFNSATNPTNPTATQLSATEATIPTATQLSATKPNNPNVSPLNAIKTPLQSKKWSDFDSDSSDWESSDKGDWERDEDLTSEQNRISKSNVILSKMKFPNHIPYQTKTNNTKHNKPQLKFFTKGVDYSDESSYEDSADCDSSDGRGCGYSSETYYISDSASSENIRSSQPVRKVVLKQNTIKTINKEPEDYATYEYTDNHDYTWDSREYYDYDSSDGYGSKGSKDVRVMPKKQSDMDVLKRKVNHYDESSDDFYENVSYDSYSDGSYSADYQEYYSDSSIWEYYDD
ncbi:uncharacterized protein LOC143063147 [Mytilus galloprovincialis]|uniref:uncharacterized protein LOC143063147 n=1 Tax=Mytilus galloprovincialis TaxID=29158 RepID=UPI003F7CBDC5